MRALITGINGFVGPYLKEELEKNGYEVFGFSLSGGSVNKYIKCDITDACSVFKTIKDIKPDYIFHLAGFSSVAKSFDNFELCFNVNVNGTKNLLDAVLKSGLRSKILIVSSSEVYGKPRYLPLDEKHTLNPVSPYGKSRLEQEKLALSYDLPIIISRSFNHTGENQPTTFVIPSFKKQIENAEDGEIIYVGNLDVVRDFSHVKDVVKAYMILLEKGSDKEIYNVGSGVGYKLRDILDAFIKESGKSLDVKIDPSRYRDADILELVADNNKLLGLKGISFRKLFNC